MTVAATIDLSSAAAALPAPFQGHGALKAMSKRLDLSLTDGDLKSGEYAKLFNVSKGTHVQAIIAKVITPEGAAATMDVGDYTGLAAAMTAVDADGFLDGLDVNAAANTVKSSLQFALAEGAPNTVAPAYGVNGKFFTADGSIVALANDALDAAVIDFTIVYFGHVEIDA